MITAFPEFVARPPWWGGDLQTLRNYVAPGQPRLPADRSRRLELPMADGSGDRLAAALDRPGQQTARPLVMLIHGLTGCEDSVYVRRSAAYLLGLGYPVLRLNLRGAGPSGPLCRQRYHAGRSQDLRDALAALDPALKARGLLAVGYSLGANMLLKFLGEEGAGAPFLAAASVSAPIDLAATSRRFHRRRNALYIRYMMARIKAECLTPHADLDGRERAAIGASRSVYEFDQVFVAPRNGFADAEDYYAKCMALPFLDAIRVPTLVIAARNDPWVAAAPYLDFDWSGRPSLMPLIAAGGGHVGFHGRGGTAAWHDRCIARHFAEAAAAAADSA